MSEKIKIKVSLIFVIIIFTPILIYFLRSLDKKYVDSNSLNDIRKIVYNIEEKLNEEDKENLDSLYNKAIKDTMIAEEYEKSNNLIIINKENSDLEWDGDRVLMSTWTQYPEAFKEGNEMKNDKGDLWVYVGQEMKEWYKKNEGVNINNFELRIKQLLGLPENKECSYFVELWVNTSDLFRPCINSSIENTDIDLYVNNDVQKESDYKKWYNNKIIESYFPPEYPWTRLGYTYDWGSNFSEIGLCEFVIEKNSKLIVERKLTNDEYRKKILEGN